MVYHKIIPQNFVEISTNYTTKFCGIICGRFCGRGIFGEMEKIAEILLQHWSLACEQWALKVGHGGPRAKNQLWLKSTRNGRGLFFFIAKKHFEAPQNTADIVLTTLQIKQVSNEREKKSSRRAIDVIVTCDTESGL